MKNVFTNIFYELTPNSLKNMYKTAFSMTHHLLAAILNPPCKISKKFRWGSKERMSMSRFIAQRVINEYFFRPQKYYFFTKKYVKN